MRSYFLSCTQSLSKSLILNKSISFIRFHGRNFNLDISNETKFIKNFSEMRLSIIRRLIFHRSVDNRDKIINILIINTVGDNIPSLNVICKKNFKIRIMHIMNCHINIMILRARIGRIFNSMEFHVSEITYDLYFLYLSVIFHYLLNKMLVHLLKPAYEKLSD